MRAFVCLTTLTFASEPEATSTGMEKPKSPPPLLSATALFSRYPGYTGDLNIVGGATVTEVSNYTCPPDSIAFLEEEKCNVQMTFAFSGAEDVCTGHLPHESGKCVLVVYEGTSCDVLGRSLWDYDEDHENWPWDDAQYEVKDAASGTAFGEFKLGVGVRFHQFYDHPMVVSDSNGNPIACGMVTPTATTSTTTMTVPCTAEGIDPWLTGSDVKCCDGFKAALGNWEGDGRFYYKCVTSPAQGNVAGPSFLA